MKEMHVTITCFKYYYGTTPFMVGEKVKCVKESDNPYDSEAIKAVMKGMGTVGYIANTPYTSATGTMLAGHIWEKGGEKFVVRVMFITSSMVICEVVEGERKKEVEAHP